MGNIVFIDVDKILEGYNKIDDSFTDLKIFKDNLLKLVGDENTILFFISHKNLDAVKSNASLLINYFDAISLDMDDFIVGTLLTKDAIADLCINGKEKEDIAISCDPLENKQYEIINAIGEENISKIIHITNGISYSLYKATENIDGISMCSGYNGLASNYEKDKISQRDFTYLLSEKPGLKGMNECFDLYFQNRNILRLEK